jgi:osmoprotectant transport system permease protein
MRRLFAFILLVTATAGADPIRVASKQFTESIILGEALTILANEAGVEARHADELGGSNVLFSALLTGDIDAYPEYTGTLLQSLLAGEGLADIHELRRYLRSRGIGMSASLGFNNSYIIGVPEETAQRLGIRTISDLVDHPDLRLRFTPEWLDRGDGWPAVRDAYDLPQTDVRGMNHALGYRALAAGEADVIDLYGTDAEIDYYGLRRLDDDLGFFPRYDAVVLYRLELLEEYPQVVLAWRDLESRIDGPLMISANKAAKFDKKTNDIVARELLDAVEAGGIIAAGSPPTWWEKVIERRGDLGRAVLEHLGLVAISVGIATILALPLGILAAKNRVVGRLVLPVVGILQTIPSLALLALMIPLLAALALPAIGTLPTVIALVIYLLLPIVANTYAGLVGIADHLVESAEAIGLSPARRLLRIELPLAMPSILTGIKTSTVIAVGFATLGAFVGAGGLGEPIFKGLRLDDTVWLLLGAVPAALMAILAQWLLTLVGSFLIPRGLR